MARLLNMHPDGEVEPHLAAHLTYLKQRNQRPVSIRERRLTVLRMARRLGHPLADVTRDELKAWQLHPAVDADKELSQSSIHNAIVHIAQYCNWLVVNEIRIDDPTRALVRPQHVHQSIPTPMDDPDIIRALRSADPLMHLWIELAAYCGLRCMEIASLRRENVFLGTKPYLRVTGKGGKVRVVSLPANVLAELGAPWLPEHGHLFARLDGKSGPPTAARVSERINKHLHGLGIKNTAHKLRHSFGTKFYDTNKDLLQLAETMGHGSVDTTRGYVRVSISDATASAIEAMSRLAG